MYGEPGPDRLPVRTYYNAELQAHMATASAAGQQFAAAHGYSETGVLGYIAPPGPVTTTAQISMGVSGEVLSVPTGFAQRNMAYFSQNGFNAATDGFGALVRRAYQARKNTDQDIFLKALTMWTDNGAATLGVGWHSSDPPPPYHGPGGFNALNWSQVSTPVLGRVADQVTEMADCVFFFFFFFFFFF
mgnify:CR=1 FL=1